MSKYQKRMRKAAELRRSKEQGHINDLRFWCLNKGIPDDMLEIFDEYCTPRGMVWA